MGNLSSNLTYGIFGIKNSTFLINIFTSKHKNLSLVNQFNTHWNVLKRLNFIYYSLSKPAFDVCKKQKGQRKVENYIYIYTHTQAHACVCECNHLYLCTSIYVDTQR